VLDIIPLEVGFIYAQKTRLQNGQDTVAFYVYDQDGDRTLPVKIKTYLEAKFSLKPDTVDSNLRLKQVGASRTVLAPNVRQKPGGLQSVYGAGLPQIKL